MSDIRHIQTDFVHHGSGQNRHNAEDVSNNVSAIQAARSVYLTGCYATVGCLRTATIRT